MSGSHIVEPGDTLGAIEVDIGAANKLDGINKIYAGQVLVIPATGVARGPAT